jgi:predicted GNAT family acetyltransferase
LEILISFGSTQKVPGMYFIQFSTLRAIEYPQPQPFDQRVRKWLLLREGENTYLLEQLLRVVDAARAGTPSDSRLFTVEDDNMVVAAGMLLPGGCLCMSWATEEISDTLIAFMRKAGCHVNSVYAPGTVSSTLAQRWAAVTGQAVDYGRSERIYQVGHVTYTPPSGHLREAVIADQAALLPWIRGFVDEAEMEARSTSSHAGLLAHLIAHKRLFLWCDPQPVAMAAWIRSEGHNSINFVYVPPVHRGKGHAKAVSAGLAAHILAAGNRHCFILTDTHDDLTNHLYQVIGGHPVSDLLRCTLREAPAPVRAKPAPTFESGRLNISNPQRFTFSG